jgi:tRNA A-37 threonylcarbamoyl transferase component Bud32
VDKRYEPFCINDSLFYDAPTQDGGRRSDFAVAHRPIPPGWERSEVDDWLAYRPSGGPLPLQGWKIHSSARLDNADEIIGAVWEYCIPRRIAFKFIRNAQLLLLRNAKSANRFSSGKFVTIYPADEAQLEAVLTELGAMLAGQAGPYILSDLRWGEGPLYVRYGGFVARFCSDSDGDPRLAIEDADGQLVPDRRGPFEIPDWVTLPDFLQPHLLARNSAKIEDLPYTIQRALHFSNAGGVYLGVDRAMTEQVVIKEARPEAGLSADGADAIVRLQREREILEQLAGLDAVPAVREYFIAGEHHFLVQDFVEGETLDALFVAKYPLIVSNCDERTIAEYADWAVELCGRVERAVGTVHDRGIFIRDLHPSNILIRPDGRIAIVDWETAVRSDERRAVTLGNVVFGASTARTGIEADRYALACLRLYLFLPLTALISIDPSKSDQLGKEICARFPVPPDFIAEAVQVIRGEKRAGGNPRRGTSSDRFEFGPDPASWHAARAAMSRAILASATPDRHDRLFPGDIAQFAPGGGLNLAYGAAGVLYALHVTGAGRHPEHEEWLIRHIGRSQGDLPIGLYDGLDGVAHTLDRLGRHDEALGILDICVDRLGRNWDHLKLDLFGGLAGIGLNLSAFAAATGDAALWDLARRCAEVLAGRLALESGGGRRSRVGLFYGSTGPALMFLDLYGKTGDVALLDLAESALDQDLSRCVLRDDGSLHVDEGWRTMPYLAEGSVGIGMVLDRFLSHRAVEHFAEAASAVRKAAEAEFYIQAGISRGVAGMILYLGCSSRTESSRTDPSIAAQLRRLARYAVVYEDGLAFPGEQLLRLSMDLLTGTAGVMLALGAALHEHPVHLPFLDPLPAEGTGSRDSSGVSIKGE